MERDSALELENRIAMMSRFATDFATENLGAPSGYYLPRLQWLARFDQRGKLPLPGGSCVDRRGLARRAGQRAGECDVGRGAQPAGKGQAGPRHGRQSGTGLLQRRYTAVTEETERALPLLSERLSTTVRQRGEAG